MLLSDGIDVFFAQTDLLYPQIKKKLDNVTQTSCSYLDVMLI